MSSTLWKLLVASALASLLATGCATTAPATKKARVETDDGDEPGGKQTKQNPNKAPPSGKKVASAETGPAAPTEVMPNINAKAKLAFEDAVKAFDNAKKTGTYDFATLEKKFQQAADADSALAEADYNLGVLAEKQGKTKDAVEHYRAALNKRPTLRQAMENLGVIAQNSGDEPKAISIYNDILSNFPEDASSRARLAELSRRHGETEKAMTLAREALFRDPKTLQAYKTMMQIYFEQKQFSMARLIALRASKIESADPEILYTLGLINLAEKDTAKARVNFKATIDARPDFMPAVYQLAKMAMSTEDYQTAESHLRRILSTDGKNVEALVDLGVAYKGMGQLDKAMAAYDAAQKVNPDVPAIYLNRGVIIGLKGEPEKAIAMFNQYISMRSAHDVIPGDHPVHALIKEQEAAIQKREDDKKAAIQKAEDDKKAMEEAAKMEAEEKRLKEEELKKSQSEAKGNLAKDAAAAQPAPGETPKDAKDPKKGDPKKGEPKDAKKPEVKEVKKDEVKKAAPPAPPPPTPPAPKKGSGDEPTDGL